MKKLFGFLAVAGLMTLAAPIGQAQAASLISPATAASVKYASDNMTVQVRHGGGGGGHGGGFHGGGFHGGGFHGGGFHGGGFRGGFHDGGFRGFHHHHGARFFIGSGFAYPSYYASSYYYDQPRLFCRRVWTDFGPRRICRYRPWW